MEWYWAKNNLTNKALLIRDNFLGYPIKVSDTSDNVKVKFLPKNMNSTDPALGSRCDSHLYGIFPEKNFLSNPKRN